MKKILLTIKIGLLFCFLFAGAVKAQTANIYEYYNSTYQKHFYTTDYNEIGTGKYGFTLTNNVLGSLFTVSGGEPVYRYLQSSTGAHYYTSNPNQVPSGFQFEKIMGYAPPLVAIRNPVYEYYNPQVFDYCYTTFNVGIPGYNYVRIAYYAGPVH